MDETTTIKQSFADFLLAMKSRYAKHTLRSYHYALEHFAAHVAEHGVDVEKDQPPTLLDNRTFELFPSYLLDLNYSRRTINVYLAAMLRYYRWLIRERVVRAPNAFEAEMLRDEMRSVSQRKPTRSTRLPEREDAPHMIEAAKTLDVDSPEKERDIALVMFLYTTGARAFEAADLRIRDLNMKKRTAEVIGKGNIEGTLYFTDEVAQALQEYWKARGWADPKDPVFARHDKGAGRKGRKPISTKTVWNIVDQVREAAGIEKGHFSPHWFRHAAAMEVQRVGKDISKTAKFLRHRGFGTVQVYAEALDSEVQDLHKKVFGE